MSTTPVAVIPARGGSKRVPRKNVKELAGVPLVVYSIRRAIESALFDRVVVSTDDDEIRDVSLEAGAQVIPRDAGTADDHTPVSEATIETLDKLAAAGADFAIVAQLMPNCPLRSADDLVESHRSFIASGAPAQISVTRFGWQNPWWAAEMAEDGTLQPIFAERMQQRSQDLPTLFCPSGSIWWASTAALRAAGSFHQDGTTAWEMPWHRAVDIDEADDWHMAEAVLRLGAP